METKANYVLIGAFTLLVAIFLLLFGLWAAKYSSERTWQEYEVVFNEAVTGLSVGSPVQYNGISVGSVTDLSLAPDDPRQVLARIRVDSKTPIKTDTRAKLAMTSLTGPTIIQLSGGTPQSPALDTVDQRQIPIIQTTPSALQNIADTSSRIVDRLDKLLDSRNVESIGGTLQNLEALSAALADEKEGLPALITSARDSVQRLEATLDTTNATIARIDQGVVEQLPPLLEKLDTTLVKLNSAAGNADAMLGENRAAINSFTNDGLSQLGPTLAELRSLIRDLRRMTDRLDSGAGRYLTGRGAPKEYEPE